MTKKLHTILSSTLIAMTLGGCSAGGTYEFCSFGNVATDLKSFSKEHEYKKVLVNEVNGLGALICTEFNEKGIECSTYDQVFSPLDDYTMAQIAEKIETDGYDSFINVQGSSSETSSHSGGSFTTINTQTLGNTTNGTMVTNTITMYSRSYSIEYMIYDVKSHSKIYTTIATTTGSGSACITNDSYWRSQAEYLIPDILK